MTNPKPDDAATPLKVDTENVKTDQLKDRKDQAETHQEALLDEAVEESMDASDPPSPKHIT